MPSVRSTKLEGAVKQALSLLAAKVSVAEATAPTHRVVTASGWNADPTVRKAVACYLVALRVCAVNSALRVRAQLTDTPDSEAEVIGNVESIVGVGGTGLTKEQKERVRNPWIAEGLWHLCFCLAKGNPQLHPAGKIIAVSQPHLESTEHGLDIAAIYQDTTGFALSLVETKAYQKRPNSALSDAAKFYRKVDGKRFDLKIRQAIQHMRAELPPALKNRIHEELWRRARCYMPNPHYDAQYGVAWTNARPSLKNLSPGNSGIIIMPHAISGFDAYFRQLADEMLAFAKTL